MPVPPEGLMCNECLMSLDPCVVSEWWAWIQLWEGWLVLPFAEQPKDNSLMPRWSEWWPPPSGDFLLLLSDLFLDSVACWLVSHFCRVKHQCTFWKLYLLSATSLSFRLKQPKSKFQYWYLWTGIEIGVLLGNLNDLSLYLRLICISVPASAVTFALFRENHLTPDHWLYLSTRHGPYYIIRRKNNLDNLYQYTGPLGDTAPAKNSHCAVCWDLHPRNRSLTRSQQSFKASTAAAHVSVTKTESASSYRGRTFLACIVQTLTKSDLECFVYTQSQRTASPRQL